MRQPLVGHEATERVGADRTVAYRTSKRGAFLIDDGRFLPLVQVFVKICIAVAPIAFARAIDVETPPAMEV